MGRRAHGEGTITKRKDGSWMGQISAGYRMDGKRKRISVYGATQKEVRTKLQDLKQQLATGTFSDTKIGVEAYLEQWLEHIKPDLKERTFEGYRYTIDKYILPALGRRRLTQLKPLEIQSLINEIAKSSGGRTANLCRAHLYSALKQAVHWELLVRNPVEATRYVKTKKRKQVVWTREEATKFLRAAEKHRLYALFYCAMATGLRHGELLNLRWEDITDKVLVVRKAKTEKGVRRVGLSPDVVDVLREHSARQEKEKRKAGDAWADPERVFASKLGTRLDPRNVTRIRHRLVEKAGVRRATLHDLRHLNVSMRRQVGQDAKLIADQIGHTDPAFTTKLYTHLFEEDRRTAGVNLQQALRGGAPASGDD